MEHTSQKISPKSPAPDGESLLNFRVLGFLCNFAGFREEGGRGEGGAKKILVTTLNNLTFT